MTKSQIKELVLAIVNEVDYDIAKDYDPKTAEEPEYAEERLDALVDIVEKKLKKFDKDNSVRLKKQVKDALRSKATK